jgi:MoxR-like ATPase
MSTNVTNLPEAEFETPDDRAYKGLGAAFGDRRDGRVYLYNPDVRTAIGVAQAIGRPLLLRGPAGSGKSSLAPFVARQLRRRFYWITITARTEARDLMWQFDALKRLNDAQIQADEERQRVSQLQSYLEPGVLWWAFSPATARRRGLPKDQTLRVPAAIDPGIGPRTNGVVVLIDEIDKADPDLPNNLLECLGSLQFRVQETGDVIRAKEPPLVIVTTNDERELPAAFLRRCAILRLPDHDPGDLLRIATYHFRGLEAPAFPTDAGRTLLYTTIATRLQELKKEAQHLDQREPSTAEYLDAVRACLVRGIRPDDPAGEWPHLERLTLRKHASPSNREALAAAAEGLTQPL